MGVFALKMEGPAKSGDPAGCMKKLYLKGYWLFYSYKYTRELWRQYDEFVKSLLIGELGF